MIEKSVRLGFRPDIRQSARHKHDRNTRHDEQHLLVSIIVKEKPEVIELRWTKYLSAARGKVVTLRADIQDKDPNVAVTKVVME